MKKIKKDSPLIELKGEHYVRIDIRGLLSIVTAIVIIKISASNPQLIIPVIDYIIKNLLSQYP